MWAKMKTHNIRQKDIAERVGVTEQYLSMVFNGKRESSVIFGKIENAIDEIIAEQQRRTT
jgi:transcriptional regulator with XRE-family HTH domain